MKLISRSDRSWRIAEIWRKRGSILQRRPGARTPRFVRLRRKRFADSSAPPAFSGQLFLEPVMRIRVVVVGVDLDVSRTSVHGNGFAQNPICVEPDHSGSCFNGESLQLPEKPPSQT